MQTAPPIGTPVKSRTIAYVAIRLANGRQWLDYGTISHLPNTTRDHAAQIEKSCGSSWTKANPVIRIAMITLDVAELQDTPA